MQYTPILSTPLWRWNRESSVGVSDGMLGLLRVRSSQARIGHERRARQPPMTATRWHLFCSRVFRLLSVISCL